MADETNETSNTATGLQLQRWTLRGDCAAAQGRDGVLELTRTAYAALRAAAWEKSAAAPSMPVHDNGQVANKEIPEGDAWKCSYGYDETARTERAAAGAVCYTAELPAGAWTGDGCNVETVAVRVVGDRYLDQGAIVRVALTDDPAPPSVAAFEALATAAGPLCATSGQTDAKGAELTPNNRTGEREDAEISFPEGTAAKRYLHVALFLADYLGARGAWIEGGAMIAPDTIAVTFDRAVPAATLPQVRLVKSSTKPYAYTSGSSSYTIVNGEYAASFSTDTILGTRYPETGRPFLLALLSGSVGRYGANGADTIPSIGAHNGAGLASAGVLNSPPFPDVEVTGLTYWASPELQPGHSASISFEWRGYGTTGGSGRLRIVAIETDTPETMPDWGDPAFWNGTAANCIACGEREAAPAALANGSTAQDSVELVIRRPPTKTHVQLWFFVSDILDTNGDANAASIDGSWASKPYITFQ